MSISLIALALIQTTSALAQDHLSYEAYEKIFPVHAEYCAGSKVDAYKEGDGGYGGHALLFINGLCKDYSVKFPKVAPCSKLPASDHRGVGVNVNGDYRNVNWVAVPDRDFFFNGSESPDVVVDDALVKKLGETAFTKRVYEGVYLNPEIVKPNDDRHAYELAATKNGIGTDIGIRMGRTLKCVRIPLSEKSLQPISDYLNKINAPYLAGTKQYKWSGLYDNCAHLSANTLATAGVRSSIATNQFALAQLFDVAIPYNGAVTLWERTQHTSIALRKVYSRKIDRKNLIEKNWLPTGLGAISLTQSFYKNNKININTPKALHEVPPKAIHRFFTIQRHVDQSLNERRFLELKANAKYWLGEYKKAYKEALADYRFKDEDFRIAYLRYIESQIEKAQAILNLAN